MRSEIISQVTTQFREALEDDQTSKFEDKRYDNVRRLLKDISYDIEETLLWRLREAMPEGLASAVHNAAEKAITAVLEGNQKELERWLSCDTGCYNGRSDGYNPGFRDPMHPIIHGKLFEQGAIALRKQIVDAHPELLKTQRMLDLEDQLASVVAQYNKLRAERDREQMAAF